MVKEAKVSRAQNPGSGDQLNKGLDLRAATRISGRNSPMPGGCGGNADRIIAAVRDGLEALRLEIQKTALEQQKHFEDALSVHHEDLANAIGEVHPEIQDLEDEVDEDVDHG